MGCKKILSSVWKFLKRLVESPVSTTPTRYVWEEDYDQAGKKRWRIRPNQLRYEVLAAKFFEKARRDKEPKREERTGYLGDYPEWDAPTVDFVTSLFNFYSSPVKIGFISRAAFTSLLTHVDDRSSPEVRAVSFIANDADNDGYMTVDEFLRAIYYLSSSRDEYKGARTALELRDRAQMSVFVRSLSLQEQLEFGLC